VPIITQDQVTHWETTPSFALLLTNDLPLLRSLRFLVVGSDKLTWAAAQALRQALPANTQLLNSYGLTECTIDSSFWVVPPQLNIATAKLNRPTPVGFPLPNQQLWVMDRYLQPLPIWAVGEVWIAGYSLADDTLWQDEKLYATGDLGYYHPEDGLVLVGRSDTQLKINGLRINPKEVEQALLQFSLVVQVAVVQHHSHQQLVAWIQTSDPHFNWAEQRQQLFAFLPSYAVPHQAFAIDSFPLSAHGKIDYKALAQKPLPTLAVEPAENNTPLTPAAQALAHSLRQIGAPETTHWDRSLYENGLHSIQVIRLVGLLREAGWHIALPQILQSESLLQIAKLLTNAHPQKNPQTFEKLADEDIDWDNLLDALNEQLD
jgi:acyl-CoA synthetase (AMP-forming)/AMP-acid ligase II/aryl carrier-like protein